MRLTKAPSPWQKSHTCMERMLRRLSKGMSSFKEFFNFGLNFPRLRIISFVWRGPRVIWKHNVWCFRSLLAGPELTITVASPREDNEVIQTSLPLVNCAYRLGMSILKEENWNTGRLPSRGPTPLPNYIPFWTEKVYLYPFLYAFYWKIVPPSNNQPHQKGRFLFSTSRVGSISVRFFPAFSSRAFFTQEVCLLLTVKTILDIEWHPV